MKSQHIYDISPPISEFLAVWPGDVAFTRATQLDLKAGHNISLNSFSATVHLGAHADAPSHYSIEGASIDAVALEPYVGLCTVVTCSTPDSPMIEPADCEAAVRRGAQRILFRTLSYPDPTHFHAEFTAFTPEAIAYMGQAGVLLIGIDTPSVDPFNSKALPAHQQLLRWGMRNLEGLLLKDVSDGDYELIALPLKLVGFDASPVRAVLRAI